MKIGIDMGHTLSGAGTSANGYVRESDKNREAGKRLIEMLQEKGHTVVNCTVDVSSNDLADRVKKANAQTLDLFISLHLNAYQMTTSEMGVETHIYNGSWTGKESNRKTAQAVQTALVQMVGWKDRRVKESNFYVLRETKAPAILVELGFCDSKGDMDKWNTEKIAAAIFKGATGVEYVAPTPAPSNGTMYRVVCGSYSSRDTALAQQNKLKAAGFDSFLDAFQKDGKTFFRVICGSYKDRVNAEKIVSQLKAKGFDSFIAIYGEEPKTSTPAPQPPKPTPAPPINNDDVIVKEYAEKGYAIPRTTVNVRNKPSVNGNNPVAKYNKGERINSYDKVVVTNAYTWISYVSASGTRRYVAVLDRKTNQRMVDCY